MIPTAPVSASSGKNNSTFFEDGFCPEAVVIGGSAGSIQPVCRLIKNLRPDFSFPLFLVLHRYKYLNDNYFASSSNCFDKYICEPNDRERICGNRIYVAPPNYHMLVVSRETIRLSADREYNYSRPSIDLTFCSLAEVYQGKLMAIILSGANSDGATGMKEVKRLGGKTIIQAPGECEVRTMPEAVKKIMEVDAILCVPDIINVLNTFNCM